MAKEKVVDEAKLQSVAYDLHQTLNDLYRRDALDSDQWRRLTLCVITVLEKRACFREEGRS